MKYLVVAAVSLLLLSLPTSATPAPAETPAFLTRQLTCRRPRVMCPGRGCISCREVGRPLVRALISLRQSILRGNPTFIQRMRRLEALIRPGGRADFAARMFRRDCCLRVFGNQVAQEVPGLIAYGYLGRVVYPGSFLLGFAGFEKQNPGATFRDFVDVLGNDFRGEFFGMCRVAGLFEQPCLRGPLRTLRPRLVRFARLNNLQHEVAAQVGLALGQTIGAFTENEALVSRFLRMDLRALQRPDLKRCC